MEIEELHLRSPDPSAQEEFYGKVLGLPIELMSDGGLAVKIGENQLFFHPDEPSPHFYHFCFLIPTGSLEAAIEFCAEVGLELLLNKGEAITHFENGRSIYFHDADDNIAEFIERPLVAYPHKESFNILDLIKVNEIGLPTPDPERIAHELCQDYGIIAMAPENFDENFCWVGDHEGVILSVQEGRGWLPTGRPSIASPFRVKYREGSVEYDYRFQWSDLNT